MTAKKIKEERRQITVEFTDKDTDLTLWEALVKYFDVNTDASRPKTLKRALTDFLAKSGFLKKDD